MVIHELRRDGSVIKRDFPVTAKLHGIHIIAIEFDWDDFHTVTVEHMSYLKSLIIPRGRL